MKKQGVAVHVRSTYYTTVMSIGYGGPTYNTRRPPQCSLQWGPVTFNAPDGAPTQLRYSLLISLFTLVLSLSFCKSVYKTKKITFSQHA